MTRQKITRAGGRCPPGSSELPAFIEPTGIIHAPLIFPVTGKLPSVAITFRHERMARTETACIGRLHDRGGDCRASCRLWLSGAGLDFDRMAVEFRELGLTAGYRLRHPARPSRRLGRQMPRPGVESLKGVRHSCVIQLRRLANVANCSSRMAPRPKCFFAISWQPSRPGHSSSHENEARSAVALRKFANAAEGGRS